MPKEASYQFDFSPYVSVDRCVCVCVDRLRCGLFCLEINVIKMVLRCSVVFLFFWVDGYLSFFLLILSPLRYDLKYTAEPRT